MARSCGLRLGSRRFEAVVLDGTAKKPKVVDAFAGDLPPHTPEFEKERRRVLKEVFQRAGKGADDLGVALDARGAAFRRQTLPLADTTKIESVLKYEVESQLPQFNIDDVSVDWMVLDQAGDSSKLLVTAVPKNLLEQVIEDCTKAGAEPLELELETSAMVNAAQAAGVLAPDSAQVLVHVGETTTAVAVVDAGKVREMRAIHIGALAAEQPTAAAEPQPEDDRSAEQVLEDAENATEDDVDEAPAEWAPARIVTGHQLDEVLSRVRRELSRTVSGARTANQIENIYVCGYRLPGMIGMEVMGVRVEPLEGYAIEDGATQFHDSSAVAYGAALARMGGGLIHAKLRRDELMYTGTLERLELPLAVVALLLVTFLGVQQIFLTKEIRQTHGAIGSWRDSSNNYMVGDPRKGNRGNLANPKEPKKDAQGNIMRVDGVEQMVGPMDGLINYVNNFTGEDADGKFIDDPQMPDRVAQLEYIEGEIQRKILELQRELGQVTDVPQPPSAFHGMSAVLETFADNLESQGWRPSFRRLRATSSDRKGREPSVEVALDLTFFADSDSEATRHYENWKALVEGKPWCRSVDGRGNTPLANGKGIFIQGLKVDVDPTKLGGPAS